MPLRAVLTFDGAPIGTRVLALRDRAPAPQWVKKQHLADAVKAAAASSSSVFDAAGAAAALAALPDGKLIGLVAIGDAATVSAGPGVALCLLNRPNAGSPALVQAGTVVALTAGGARFGVRVEEVDAGAGGGAAAAASKKRAATVAEPPPPPRPHRAAMHAKALASLAAAASDPARATGPLAGLRIALLDPDPIQERAAVVATRLGADVAWLAPDEPLTAWPASQAGGVPPPGGATCPPLLTPYTHIVAQDPASASAKARLRSLGLLPPRVVRPPTQPTQPTQAVTQPPPPPPPPPPPAWNPPPGAPAVVGAAWLHACNKARAALAAASFAAAWLESTLAKEARMAGLSVAPAAAATTPPSAKKRRNGDTGAAAAAVPTPPPAVRPPLPAGYLPLPLPLPAPGSPDTACALFAAAAEEYARYDPSAAAGAAPEPGVTTTATARTARHGKVVTWASTAPRPRPGGLPPAAPIKWTGGNSGLAWGTGDVWIEPFDPDGVRETLRLLYAHWMPSRRKAKLAAAYGGGSALPSGNGGAPHSDTDDDRYGETSSDDEDDQDGGPVRLNGVCGHAACSARPFCVVATLRQANDMLYSKTGGAGETGFFRGRALRLGTDALEAWPTPLRTRADMERLHSLDKTGVPKALGPKTYDKIWEVLSSGTLQRLEMARADPLHVARKTLTGVWGVGDKTAAKWVAAGIRTIADLRAEAALPEGGRVGTLTINQRLGLDHFEDFATRIPAIEVDAVVAAAREAAFEAMGCDERGYPRNGSSSATAPAHVRACGSWLRAHAATDIPASARGLAAARQADYGDVDLLISPPPSSSSFSGRPSSPGTLTALTREETEKCNALLRRVLAGLSARGFEIKGGDEDDISASRVSYKVRRATLVDAGNTAALDHLVAGARASAVPGAPASWMGAIRLPVGHPALRTADGDPPRPRRWRRLDTKVYSRAALPTAVSYFTGDGSFNRALRYYSKSSPTARESALAWAGSNSGATGWHLSDTRLFPISQPKRPRGVRADDPEYVQATRRPVGPPVVLTCETDIFKTLGLAYVPPFCRTFTSRAAKDKIGYEPP